MQLWFLTKTPIGVRKPDQIIKNIKSGWKLGGFAEKVMRLPFPAVKPKSKRWIWLNRNVLWEQKLPHNTWFFHFSWKESSQRTSMTCKEMNRFGTTSWADRAFWSMGLWLWRGKDSLVCTLVCNFFFLKGLKYFFWLSKPHRNVSFMSVNRL